MAKFPFSKAGFLNSISKMNLQKGDVLVCRDYQTLDYLAHVQLPLGFTVPLVFSPQGIQKLSRQDLLNLLEQLDQQEVVELNSQVSAPV